MDEIIVEMDEMDTLFFSVHQRKRQEHNSQVQSLPASKETFYTE